MKAKSVLSVSYSMNTENFLLWYYCYTKEDFELSLFQLGCQFLPLFPFLNGTLRIHFAESNSDVFSQIVFSTE